MQMQLTREDLKSYLRKALDEREIDDDALLEKLTDDWTAMLTNYCGYMAEWADELVEGADLS